MCYKNVDFREIEFRVQDYFNQAKMADENYEEMKKRLQEMGYEIIRDEATKLEK